MFGGRRSCATSDRPTPSSSALSPYTFPYRFRLCPNSLLCFYFPARTVSVPNRLRSIPFLLSRFHVVPKKQGEGHPSFFAHESRITSHESRSSKPNHSRAYSPPPRNYNYSRTYANTRGVGGSNPAFFSFISWSLVAARRSLRTICTH